MSHLLVYPLRSTREQTVIVTKNINVKTIRLNLYKHLQPSGNLVLSIKNGSTTIATSTLAINALDSADYSHGFYSFDIDIKLTPKEYTLELSSTGYTFNDNAYIGWIKEHENNTNNFTTSIDNYYNNPFSYQIWEYK